MSTRDQNKVAEAWARGQLSWKYDSNQDGMAAQFHEATKKTRIVVANASRQIGKSVFALVLCLEYGFQNPGSQIKYAATTAKQVRKILRPHMRMLLEDCPEHLRPRFHSQDGEYRFVNGSVMTLAGTDRDNVETLRGQHAHFSVVDEGGMMDDLEYVVKDVLLPQTLNTNGHILIISTPAPTAGHAFKAYCDAAEEKGALIERTVYENPRLSEETIAEYCAEAGGEDSTTWKREYLIQHVTDSATAVIPEATRPRLKAATLPNLAETDTSYRPSHFDTYIWVDPGWNPDFTGILWAIWDFPRARVIVEDEFVMRQLDTEMLRAVLLEKTTTLWGTGHRPHLGVSDLDGRLIADLAKKYPDGSPGWRFMPTAKDNLDQAVNQLRLSVSGQTIPFVYHPRCTGLRRQLENCTWNKSRTKFNRTTLDGHFDLVSAAIYGRRNLQTWRNPMPFAPHVQKGMGLIIEDQQPEKGVRASLKRMFSVK